ncbi:heptaprenyl diphosphate synthase component 1 [Virgibacillus ainsalahensis]
MNTSSTDIHHYKALINDKIHHTYLDRFIQKPIIDEEKLKLLAAIINNTALSERQKERYILTTMLAQIALDTHDLVPESNELDKNNGQNVPIQLNVLAGDYYSGLYYLLLSEIDDFEFIHILASAIKEVNEYKMRIYCGEEFSFQEYIDMIEKVESLLIIHVAKYLGDMSLVVFSGKWLITNKLIQVKERIDDIGYSQMIEIWLGSTPSNHTYTEILNKIDTTIATNLRELDQSLLKLPNHHRAYKNHLIPVISKHMYKNTTMAEEG